MQGKLGSALSLNGSTQYVSISALNITFSQATLSAWIYSNANQPNNYVGLMYSRNSSGSGYAAPGFGICYGNSGGSDQNQLGYQWDSSEYLWSSGLIVPNGQWVFVALVVNSSGGSMYMGVPGTGLSSATHSTSETAPTFNGELDLGWDSCGVCGGQNRHFNGKIDDLRVYNRALSAADVTELYNVQSTIYLNKAQLNNFKS